MLQGACRKPAETAELTGTDPSVTGELGRTGRKPGDRDWQEVRRASRLGALTELEE